MSPEVLQAGAPASDYRCPHCGYSLAGLPAGTPCPECGREQPPAVLDERPCLRCGYSLRGLPRSGVCPECGTPIALSLRGNLLVYSAPGYVASLHRGGVLLEWGIALTVVASVAGFAGAIAMALAARAGGPAYPLMVLWEMVSLVLSAMSLVGWWMLSTPDPAYVGSDDGSTARKVLRGTLVVSAVAFVVSSGIQLALGAAAGTFQTAPSAPGAPPTVSLAMLASIVAGIASTVAWIVQFFAAMQYIRWLAPRIPDATMARRARLYLWLLPLLYVVGAICLGLGPLVAMVLYVLLLDALRRGLRGIRTQIAYGVPA